MTGLPMEVRSVSVVVPNLNGAHMLGECLRSIVASELPEGTMLEIIVVDNGSNDESERVARAITGVQWVGLDRNVGFAAAVNRGAQAATGDVIAFFNNDVVIGRRSIAGMLDSFHSSHDVGAVSCPMLDATGTKVDFVDAAMNFHGFADQPGFGAPAASLLPSDRDLPFACGGAMLVPRSVFLELGGFDERYFAYFEDVDLGWRLRLAGFRIVMSQVPVRHRHSATSARMAPEQKTLLLERNALLTLIKNIGDERRDAYVAGALMLLIARSLDEMRSDRDRYRPFRRRVWGERVPATAIARLHAAAEVLEAAHEVAADRDRVQMVRRRLDSEVLGPDMVTERPIGSTSVEYSALYHRVSELFDLGIRPSGAPKDAGRIGRSRGWLRDTARTSRVLGTFIAMTRRIR